MHQLIRASAGTGKTWQLSGHFLKQLFHGARPETILATTFTRKAAGEILGRVLLRLAEASTDGDAFRQLAAAMAPLKVTPRQVSELMQQLTSQLHRLRVSTLDSFFQQVARSLTLELGLPPGWSIVDDFADSTLRQRAIDSVLAQRKTGDSRQLMQMLAKGRSRRSVRSLINEAVEDYYEIYLQTPFQAWDRIPRAAGLPEEDRQVCVETLRAVSLSGRLLPKTRAADLESFQSGNWVRFLTKGIPKSLCAGRQEFGRKPLPEEVVDAYQPLVRHAQSNVVNQIVHRNQAAWKLIARFDAEYQQLRRQTGLMGFSEVTRLLARSGSTVDGHRINYRLDSSLQHLLLDEFQDTSLDQWNVLRRLVTPLVQANHHVPSSVFCVGDPKQAIYGWRGGLAEIMDQVPSAVPGMKFDTMDASRRSAPAVIDTVNHVFQRLHRHSKLGEYGLACREWEQAFPLHSTHRADLPGFAEFRTSPNFDDGSVPDKTAAWYGWVAGQIRDIHVRCPGAEIGVLMRTNDGVAHLVYQLTRLGVPASEEGGTPPTDSPAVLAVMSLLYLASHPGCTVSRFHVARSPLADVVGFHHWQDDAAAVAVAESIRLRLIDDGYGATLQWIAEVISDHCSERDERRLQQVVAEAWRFDTAPLLNPAEFVQLLETSRFSRSAAAPVRVMTVHQSKGLEFDIVVAPELTRPLMKMPAVAAGGPDPVSAPTDVCVWVDEKIRHVLPHRLQEAFRSTIGAGVQGSLCLLYVTLTRAIHALHLLAPPKTRQTSKSLAGILAATMTDSEVLEADSQIWSAGDANWHQQVPHIQTIRTTGSTESLTTSVVQLAPMPDGRQRGLPRRTPSEHAPGQRPTRPGPEVAVRTSAVLDGRTRGTLMHALFELIQWLDNSDQPTADRLRTVATDPSIRHMHVSDQKFDAVLQEFLQMVTQPSTQRALSQSPTRVRFKQNFGLKDENEFELSVMTERPFAYRRHGCIVQGTIDRLVIAEKSGQRLAAEVIDFKTDRVSGELSSWVADKQADYRDQLSDYRDAVAHCFGIPDNCITSSLLLLEADVCVEVD